MGGKTATTTQQVQIPPEVLARYQNVNERAQQVAETPFQRYTGEFVAPLSPTQQLGIGQTVAASQMAQPYYQAATQLGLSGAQGIRPGALDPGAYMNPYTQAVVQATLSPLQQQQRQQLSQQQSEAVRSGAFGGDRAGLQRAALMGQQAMGTAQAIAPLYRQGYSQALQTAQQQQGLALSAEQANRAARAAAAQQLAGFGTGAQQAALAGAQGVMGAGTMEQQTRQALNAALLQQFQQERGYPFQVAQFLANIAYGAPYPTTTTTTQPVGFLGALSDRRAKKDIRRVGKTDDGMPIYKFKYKGDPSGLTHMGLMAQDVEKEKPGAVGLAGGYKTVDYDRATKFYGGGVGDSMGGAVSGPGGVADGGLADILAMQRAMYSTPGAAGATGLGAGGPYGANLAPIQRASVPSAGAVPRLPPSALQELGQTADLGEKLLGKRGLFGEEGVGAKIWDKSKELYKKFSDKNEAGGGLVAYARGGRMEDEDLYGGDTGIPLQKIEPFRPQAPGAASDPTAREKQGLSDLKSLYGMGEMAGKAGSALMEALPAVGTEILALLPFLSDKNDKANVQRLGKGLYAYDYKHDVEHARRTGEPMPPKRVGPMAQDIESRNPDLVADVDGHKVVNARGLDPRAGFADGGWSDIVEEEARKRNIPAGLLHAIIQQESGGRPDAVGSVGEIGLGQVKPSTARDPGYGVSPVDPRDLAKPEVNIPFMADYLTKKAAALGYKDLSDPAQMRSALMAYNAGSGRERYADEVLARMGSPAGGAGLAPRAAPSSPRGLAPGAASGPENEPESDLMKRAKSILPTKGTPEGGEEINWKQLIIPVLSGLGAAASSRNISPIGTALIGLGAGAESYAGLEKQQAEVDKRKAEAAIDWTRAVKEAIFKAPDGSDWVITTKGPVSFGVYKMDPARYGEPLTGPAARRAIAAIPGAKPITPDLYGPYAPPTPGTPSPPAAPGAPPAGAPAAPGAPPPGGAPEPAPSAPLHIATENPKFAPGAPTPFTVLGNNGDMRREEDLRSFVLNPAAMTAQKAKSEETEQAVRAAALASKNIGAQINELSSKLLSLPEAGFTATGPTEPARMLLSAYVQDVMSAFGIGPTYWVAPNEIGTSEAAKKITNALSLVRGAQSVEALKTALAVVPNTAMTREGIIQTLASSRVQAQRDIDRERYLDEYKKKLPAPFSQNYLAQSANAAFDRDNAETEYSAERKRLEYMMRQSDRRTGKPIWLNYFGANKVPSYFSDRQANRVGFRRYIENN